MAAMFGSSRRGLAAVGSLGLIAGLLVALPGPASAGLGTAQDMVISAANVAITTTCTGTVQTTSEGYTIVAFKTTETCTWTPPQDVFSVDYVVVAGGGGGGVGRGGGGGAGGLRTGSLSVTPGSATSVTVGAGGAGGASDSRGSSGGNSVFGSITSVGGGGGGGYNAVQTGLAGGSGGGGAGASGDTTYAGGAGTTGQGTNGGSNSSKCANNQRCSGGGGGGAAQAGAPGSVNYEGGAGGDGRGVAWITSSVASSLGVGETSAGTVYFAGGGGGSTMNSAAYSGGAGGLGGGADGLAVSGTTPPAAMANTGGGGGANAGTPGPGGVGGSGVVIVRYCTNCLSLSAGGAQQPSNYTYSPATADWATAAPKVQLADSAENPLSTSGVTVTALFTASSGSATLLNATATTGASGVADFSSLILNGNAGTTGTLTFSATGYGSVTSSSVSIGKVPLTVTAANQSVAYGTAVSTVTGAGSVTYSGFVNGDTSSVISGSVTYTTTFTNTTTVNTSGLTITPVVSGLSATNYSFIAATGTVMVTMAPVVITADDDTVVFGTPTAPPVTYTATGLVNSEDTSVFTTQPTCVTTGYSPSATAGSQFPNSCSGAGAVNYSFTYVDDTLTVVKAAQAALTVTSTSGVFGTPLGLVASGGSGTGAVTYAVTGSGTASGCVIGDDSLATTGAGTCLVTATQADDTNFNQQTSAQTAITLAPATPTALAWADDTLAFGDDTYLIPPVVNGVWGATNLAGSWTYVSDDSSVAGVDPGTGIVTAYSVGSATITGTFTPTDSSNYTTTTATMTFTVTKANQAPLSIVSDDTLVFGSSVTVLVAGGTGTGTLSVVASSGSAGCTLMGLVLTASSTGTCVLTADKPGDDDYNPAVQVTQTVTVIKADQSVSFTSSPPLVPRPNGTYEVTAVSSSGLGVALFAVGAACTSVSGTNSVTVSFTQSGTCVITAAQSGGANFNAAVSVTQSIVVGKLNQTITFTAPASKDFGDPVFALSATASSGLPVLFARDNALTTNSACSVDDTGIVTILAVGDCAITTSQAGNSVWAAASSVTQVFQILTVAPSAPFITGVNVQNGGATLTFNPPGFSGGSPVAGYQINAYPDGSNTPVTFSGCGITAPLQCTIPGLTNGVGYRFTVQAINSAGLGAQSPMVPDVNQPAITSAVRAAAVGALTARKGDATLTAAWAPLTFAQLGGGSFDRYNLRIAVAADDSTVATVSLIGDRLDDSYVFTGLDNGTAYVITVVAITSVNATPLEGNTASVSEIPARQPDPVPGTYQATSGTTGIVSWSPPVSDGGSPVIEYRIRLSTGGSTVFDDTVGAGVFSIQVGGLTRGASYDVTMTVTNDVGSSDDTDSMRQPDRPAPPVITNAAPVSVDDSTGFEVTWTAPADNGAPITGYLLTATKRSALGGASVRVSASAATADDTQFTCTSATTSCIVFAPGTVRDYSFVVAADNLAGQGGVSAPFVEPDPTPPGPGPTPPTPTPPSPQPVPGPVPPGTIEVIVDGDVDPGASGGPNKTDNGLVITGPGSGSNPGYGLQVQALAPDGAPVPLAPGAALQAFQRHRVNVDGEGFKPSTYVAVYVLNPVLAGESARALSAPVHIGTVLVGGKGTFAGSFVLPPQVAPDQYILQVVGTTATGGLLSAVLGLDVLDVDTRSISITGQRAKKAKPARVKVFGQTRDLNGKRVTARVKLAGQTKYSTGSSRTVKQGEFTWTRQTGKKVYVYFTSGDVRSNRIIIPSNKR